MDDVGDISREDASHSVISMAGLDEEVDVSQSHDGDRNAIAEDDRPVTRSKNHAEGQCVQHDLVVGTARLLDASRRKVLNCGRYDNPAVSAIAEDRTEKTRNRSRRHGAEDEGECDLDGQDPGPTSGNGTPSVSSPAKRALWRAAPFSSGRQPLTA